MPSPQKSNKRSAHTAWLIGWLVGPIPSELGRLHKVEQMCLNNNQLTGPPDKQGVHCIYDVGFVGAFSLLLPHFHRHHPKRNSAVLKPELSQSVG